MNWNSLQNSIKIVIQGVDNLTIRESDIKKQLNDTLLSYYTMKRTNHLLLEKNLKRLGIIPPQNTSLRKNSIDYDLNTEPNIKVTSNLDDLSYYNSINEYLLLFRNDNDLMYRLSTMLSQEDQYVLSKLIIHFFYDDITLNEASTVLEKTIAYFVEKEIENTPYMFFDSFISEKTFLGKLLLEISNRNEVKVHIQHIIKDIIKSIEKNNNEKGKYYLTLNFDELNDIVRSDHETDNTNNFEIIDVPNLFETRNGLYNKPKTDNQTDRKQALKKCMKSTSTYYAASVVNESIYSTIKVTTTSKYPEIEKYIGDELYKDISIITEKSLKHSFSVEQDEFMKAFYLKHLFIMSSIKNPKCYSIASFRALLKNSNNYEKLVERYRENCVFVLHLITKLLSNIKRNIPFIPKIIKHTAQRIYSFLHNKYPNMSELDLHSFVSKFYIETIIIPNLLNPQKNELLIKDKVLDVKVIKSILFLEPLLKAIARNELFVDEKDNNYVVFNPFLMQNTLNMRKIINDILEPNENNIFYNISQNSIYLGEDIYQVMCLNKDEMKIFINNYINFPDDDCIQTARFHQVYERREKILSKEKNKDANCIMFYLFYNENFPEMRKKTLCPIKKKEKICEAFSDSQYVEEIKICMKYVLANVPDFALNNGLTCEYLFESLNQIIEYHSLDYKDILISKIPLHWYSNFIVNKLEELPNEYKEDNYKKLLNELANEIKNTGEILSEKNYVLQNQMTNELNSLKRLCSLSKHQYQQVKQQELVIKLYHFINKASIPLCLQNAFQSFEIIHDAHNKHAEDVKLRYLLLEPTKNCVHSKSTKANHIKNINRFHSNNIIQFINHFTRYNDEIMKDVICSLPSDFTKRIIPKKYTNYNEDTTKANEILEKFFNIIQLYSQTNDNWIQKFFSEQLQTKKKNENDDNNKSDDDDDEDDILNEEHFLEKIEQYVIYQICLRLQNCGTYYNASPKNQLLHKDNSYKIMREIDAKFENKCKSLSWINPIQHLKIKPELLSEIQMKIASDYLDKSDNGVSYHLIIKYLSKAVCTLVNLFTFSSGSGGATIDDFAPIMCYLLIKLRPKRAISNFGLCKYFLTKKAMNQDIGFQLANLEMCLKYISSIDAKKIGLENNKDYYIQQCKEALRGK